MLALVSNMMPSGAPHARDCQSSVCTCGFTRVVHNPILDYACKEFRDCILHAGSVVDFSRAVYRLSNQDNHRKTTEQDYGLLPQLWPTRHEEGNAGSVRLCFLRSTILLSALWPLSITRCPELAERKPQPGLGEQYQYPGDGRPTREPRGGAQSNALYLPVLFQLWLYGVLQCACFGFSRCFRYTESWGANWVIRLPLRLVCSPSKWPIQTWLSTKGQL